MTTTPGNPFAFPGMGLGTPDGSGGNPVLQSLEMMRQAWTQMGGTNPFASAIPTTPILNLEELDKRIQELQAVANWLRLNMTMLQGSIQALEVQRATIATLRSFAQTASGAAAGSTGGAGEPSPLEVALGIKPHTRTSQEPPAEPAAAPKASAPEAPAAAPSGQAEDAAQPQQAWWNLLQNQFNQIAQAAAATMPTATPRPAAPSAPAKKRAAAPATQARKSPPRKATARKAAPRSRSGG